jgi:hypothetical protein
MGDVARTRMHAWEMTESHRQEEMGRPPIGVLS